MLHCTERKKCEQKERNCKCNKCTKKEKCADKRLHKKKEIVHANKCAESVQTRTYPERVIVCRRESEKTRKCAEL